MVFILLIAIMFAYYMHQKLRIRRERDHERRMERFERLMEILQKQNSDPKSQLSDPEKSVRTGKTDAEKNSKS